MAFGIKQLAGEQAGAGTPAAVMVALCGESGLDGIKQVAVHDRLVLARVSRVIVRHTERLFCS